MRYLVSREFEALERLERGEPLFRTICRDVRMVRARQRFLALAYEDGLISRGKWGPAITEKGRERLAARRHARLTDAHRAFIAAHPEMTQREIAAAVGCSVYTVYRAERALGCYRRPERDCCPTNSRQPWTPREKLVVRLYARKYGRQAIAERLGRSPEAVSHAKRLYAAAPSISAVARCVAGGAPSPAHTGSSLLV